MPHQITVTEPHPSIAKKLSNKFKSSSSDNNTVCIGSARGGAGNYRRYDRSSLTSGLPQDTTFKQPAADDSASDASSQRSNSSASSTYSKDSVASASSSSGKKQPRMMFRGIGGAGNAVPRDERRMFSFDEELEREEKLRRGAERSKVVMVGRGGAGNAMARK